MKILLDPQIFNNQKYGGISRYYTEIFVRLIKIEDVQVEVPLLSTSNIYFRESKLISRRQIKFTFFLDLINNLGISIRKKIKKINQKQTIIALKKQNFDLFIPTYYDPFFLDYIETKPFVLTVYDMIHELFPDIVLEDTQLVKNKLLLMEKATKIIAVSSNTKKDIIKIYPHIQESKIEVIYHGNSIVINDEIHIDLPKKYILFVGPRFDYKNFRFLSHSIVELLKNDSDLYLVCAGGGKLSKSETKFLKDLELNQQVLQIDFKDNELGVIYKNAICFVFPSIYEGFGIPVLESMACGCPVVLANHSSFPEVAGEAGCYFKLNDSNDLKDKINDLLNNNFLRNKYSNLGLEQTKKFNWESAAEQCLNVYKKSLCNNKQ